MCSEHMLTTHPCIAPLSVVSQTPQLSRGMVHRALYTCFYSSPQPQAATKPAWWSTLANVQGPVPQTLPTMRERSSQHVPCSLRKDRFK